LWLLLAMGALPRLLSSNRLLNPTIKTPATF
jgi:hypothetical protein